MNSCQDVTIVCGEEALHLLEEVYKRYKFLPDKKKQSGDFWMLEWWDVRWDEQFPEVSGIEQVLLRLDELVTEDEGFAYKQFIFDEDDEDTKVRVNDIGEFPLYDYFVLKSVCNSETIAAKGAAKRKAISVNAELALFLEKFLKENLWEEPLVQKQAAAVFTTACLVGDIDADTAECANLIERFYQILQSKGITVDRDTFNSFMKSALCRK